LLRYLLIEAGQTAAKDDEQLKQFYRRLLPRRGKARAKVAVGTQVADQVLHHVASRN
jgi:hypothetical protein